MRKHQKYWLDQLKVDKDFGHIHLKGLLGPDASKVNREPYIDWVGMDEFLLVEPDRLPFFLGTQFGVHPRIKDLVGFLDSDRQYAILGKSALSGCVHGLTIYSVKDGKTEKVKLITNAPLFPEPPIDRNLVIKPDLGFVAQVAKAYNKLDAGFISSIASEDLYYNSQAVYAPLEGKDEVMDFLYKKFRTVRDSGHPVFAELAYLVTLPSRDLLCMDEIKGRPCIILSQDTKENKTALIDVKVSRNKVTEICICTVTPNWWQALPTGIYPV